MVALGFPALRVPRSHLRRGCDHALPRAAGHREGAPQRVPLASAAGGALGTPQHGFGARGQDLLRLAGRVLEPTRGRPHCARLVPVHRRDGELPLLRSHRIHAVSAVAAHAPRQRCRQACALPAVWLDRSARSGTAVSYWLSHPAVVQPCRPRRQPRPLDVLVADSACARERLAPFERSARAALDGLPAGGSFRAWRTH